MVLIEEPMVLVDRAGHRSTGRIAIGAPVRDGEDRARCEVWLDGIADGAFDVVGAAPLHALIAAVRLVGARLHAHLATGGDVLVLDDAPFDTTVRDWLAPAPELEALVRAAVPAGDPAAPHDAIGTASESLAEEPIVLVSPAGARVAGRIALGRPAPWHEAWQVAVVFDGWSRASPIINETPLFALHLALRFLGFTVFDVLRRGWQILDAAGAPHPIAAWLGPYVAMPVLPTDTDADALDEP
ncbi:MAG: hypothetical protein K8W52_08995 [Deltaproteobacteria bacterium]|nr:hypothetical protein [Deltaproteobacteria bacterium]